jgi:SAM-dependent methyltransferase
MSADDTSRMMQMINGYWISQIVHAAATYSLADHLAKAPSTAEDIAKAEGTDPTATFRLMRACASLGLMTYDDESRFAATPLLDILRRGSPRSLRGYALAMPAPGHWLPWGRFVDAVKTGERQTIPALGMEIFDYLAQKPAEGSAFTEAMDNATAPIGEEVARIIDTRAAAIAVDIGGAGGTLLNAMLRANPKLKGIVFDRQDVIESATETAKKLGLQDRLSAVGGDFFDSVPAADLFLLKHILHDWDDEACIRILQSCRRSLRPGGRLTIIEFMLGKVGEPGLAPLVDLAMMVLTPGRERGQAEFQSLLEAAELRVTNVYPTQMPLVVIEAMAA